MPHFDGMEALRIARAEAPEVPFIFVSGILGEEYAIRALKNGATDYVVKTNLSRLPVAVERAISGARITREQRRAQVALEIAEILDVYRLDEPRCVKLLLRLEKIGILELHERNRIRLRISRTLMQALRRH